MSKPRLLLVDGSALLSTTYFASLPPEMKMAKSDEEKEYASRFIEKTTYEKYANGVNVFLTYLENVYNQGHFDGICVALDVSRESTFRRQMYPLYKANRKPREIPLVEQFDLLREVLKELGVKRCQSPVYEADDLIGTFVNMFKDQAEIVCLTKDHDYLQLIDKNVKIWMIAGLAKDEEGNFIGQDEKLPDGILEYNLVNMKDRLTEKNYGVYPCQIADLKGLCGDIADNIPGVPKIGGKTAQTLLQYYNSIDEIFEEIEGTDEAGRLALADRWKAEYGIRNCNTIINNLLTYKDQALLSRDLATIRTAVPGTEAIKLEMMEYDWTIDKMAEVARKFGLNGVIRHIDKLEQEEAARMEAEFEAC